MADRTRTPPRPGPLRPFRFPAFLRRRLPNGLTVLAARHAGVPLASLELVAPAGGQHDPPGRAGLATLTASLLDEGTGGRSSMEIAAGVERLGGYLSTGADWDVGYLATGMLSQHWRAGLGLLAEVIEHPTFPAVEIERLRSQRLAEILRREADPSALADDALMALIYRGTVYARSLLGDPESVAGLTRAEIAAFYQRTYTIAGTSLVAVGDLDPEEAAAAAEEALAGALATPPPSPPEIRPQRLAERTVLIVDRPGAAQTELRLGHPSVSRQHPDFVPLTVMNTLLGGKFTSRINLNLRERHGFTYGASTRFVGRIGPGPFLAGAAIATESTGAAVREVLAELERIRTDLVEVEELEDTRSYLTGVFPYTVQTIGDLAKRLETLAIYDLPDDYFDDYVAHLGTVSREEVLEISRRHLDPEHIGIVAVGPAELLEAQLEGLGLVQISGQTSGPLAGRPAPATVDA
jgi:zinc protease